MEFNSLPLEVQLEIFSYLTVGEVMRIRRTCKRWANLIDFELKFKRLSCFQQIYSNDPTDGYHFYFKSARSFLQHMIDDTKFSRVKELKAFLWPKYDDLAEAFDFLNSFKLLEEVVFMCFVLDLFALNSVEAVQKKTFTVRLSRLTKAFFDVSCVLAERLVSVVLDLPNLLHLRLGPLGSVSIVHPQTIQTLETWSTLFQLPGLDFSKFSNLKLIRTKARDVRSISASFLESLPSLLELHIGCSFLNNEETLPSLSVSKRLRVFYFGFEIAVNQINLETEWPSSFNAYNTTDDSTRFIIRNRHRSIDDNRAVESICYNSMASELDDTELFGLMFRKFPKIRYLYTDGAVTDERRLLKFIHKFQIERLFFSRTGLPRSFFELLAESCPFVRDLEIKSEPMSVLTDDLDFVFRMKKLSMIYFSDTQLSLNFAARLLKELKSISVIYFYRSGDYQFSLNMFRLSGSIDLTVNRSGYLHYNIHDQKPGEFVNELKSRLEGRLNFDGFTCPKKLLTLLRHLKIEKQNQLFMMRKYVYDQAHSICLSEEQMRLLNFSLVKF